ncbi:uncharacterized protein LOC133030598 [Cannabis sativa]|uniref:uncharacterized protein LOC133030598 n=1 Tax=Cannabis sativa TaxID=3483 RepID=UPI0029CA6EB7|nr:uncharacterized protein LOC133030598 [Cannabis sativa]
MTISPWLPFADSPYCSLCQFDKESITHALFFCHRLKRVWRSSSFHLVEQFAKILWSIWNERNKEKHGSKPKPHDVLLYFAISYLEEFHVAQVAKPSVVISSAPTLAPVSKNIPRLNPPSRRMKLNTDAAINKFNNTSGFGAILSNNNGDTIAVMSMPFKGNFRPKVMEAMALLYSLQWLKDLHLHVHYLRQILF